MSDVGCKLLKPCNIETTFSYRNFIANDWLIIYYIFHYFITNDCLIMYSIFYYFIALDWLIIHFIFYDWLIIYFIFHYFITHDWLIIYSRSSELFLQIISLFHLTKVTRTENI